MNTLITIIGIFLIIEGIFFLFSIIGIAILLFINRNKIDYISDEEYADHLKYCKEWKEKQ